MYKLVTLITAGILSLLISGCSGVETTTHLTNQDNSQPEWINNPQKLGYQVAVGQASKTVSNPERAVYLIAQGELAKQIAIYVDSQCKTNQQSSSQEASIACQSNQTTHQLMHQSQTLAKWEDADFLYILLGVANEAIN